MEPHRLLFLRNFFIFALRSPSSIAKMAKNGPCNVQIQIQIQKEATKKKVSRFGLAVRR